MHKLNQIHNFLNIIFFFLFWLFEYSAKPIFFLFYINTKIKIFYKYRYTQCMETHCPWIKEEEEDLFNIKIYIHAKLSLKKKSTCFRGFIDAIIKSPSSKSQDNGIHEQVNNKDKACQGLGTFWTHFQCFLFLLPFQTNACIL